MTVSTAQRVNGVRTANPFTTGALAETSETPGSASVRVFNTFKWIDFAEEML